MKKINLLPTLSIVQQKELAQWHRYTIALFSVIFIGAAAFQSVYLVRVYALKKDISALRKKVQPYEPFFNALQQTKQDISYLQQQIIEFKKIAQQTAARIDFVSQAVSQGVTIKSLMLHDNDAEISLVVPNDMISEDAFKKLCSSAPFSSLKLTCVQQNEKGEVQIVLQGKIA